MMEVALSLLMAFLKVLWQVSKLSIDLLRSRNETAITAITALILFSVALETTSEIVQLLRLHLGCWHRTLNSVELVLILRHFFQFGMFQR